MTPIFLRRGRTLLPALVLLLGASGGLAGCGALDVSDPTAIEDRELDDAAGAQLLRGAALKTLAQAVGDGAYASGLFTDEFMYELPVWWVWDSEAELLDRRESAQYEALVSNSMSGYRLWQELRRAATVALSKLQTYAPAPAYVGEMYAVRGFAALRLAEDFCPGFPLNDIVDLKPVFSAPFSTEAALTKALADFDSAVAAATDSARVLHLARVGRARTLLGLGRFAEAASAVADVPDDYVYRVEFSSEFDPGPINPLAAVYPWGDERSVADREGGTGLDFVTANDPRVPTDSLGIADDGVTVLYGTGKYGPGSPIELANGAEARLIEAEAALQAGEYGTWLTTLNQLRQTVGLADTTDPGTDAARVDLMFRERAFWLFGTGHRLGDLRRLLRQYGRTSESIFPTGAYWHGGAYGSGTSIPFPRSEARLSPGVTGCTDQ